MDRNIFELIPIGTRLSKFSLFFILVEIYSLLITGRSAIHQNAFEIIKNTSFEFVYLFIFSIIFIIIPIIFGLIIYTVIIIFTYFFNFIIINYNRKLSIIHRWRLRKVVSLKDTELFAIRTGDYSILSAASRQRTEYQKKLGNLLIDFFTNSALIILFLYTDENMKNFIAVIWVDYFGFDYNYIFFLYIIIFFNVIVHIGSFVKAVDEEGQFANSGMLTEDQRREIRSLSTSRFRRLPLPPVLMPQERFTAEDERGTS